MERSPSDSYSLTLRVKLSTRAGTHREVTTAIGRAGGDIGVLILSASRGDRIIRDITVNTVSKVNMKTRSSRKSRPSTASRSCKFPIRTF